MAKLTSSRSKSQPHPLHLMEKEKVEKVKVARAKEEKRKEKGKERDRRETVQARRQPRPNRRPRINDYLSQNQRIHNSLLSIYLLSHRIHAKFHRTKFRQLFLYQISTVISTVRIDLQIRQIRKSLYHFFT
eukprot:SAG11_NODE_986_length_6284_cov_72.758771_2_plen_131_part_00